MPNRPAGSGFVDEAKHKTDLLASRDRQSWLVTDHGVKGSTEVGGSAGQQGALDAAAAALSALGGGVLRIPDYTTIIVTDFFTLANNIALVGGPGSTIRKENAAVPRSLDLNRKADVLFEGITFDMGPREFADLADGANSVNGIRLVNSKRVTIRRCTFLSSARSIVLNGTASGGGCADVTIEGNDFGIVGDIAIDTSPGFSVAPTKNVRILDNTVRGVTKKTTLLAPWSAFYLKADGIEISGNQILQSDDTAIMLGDGCTDFLVDANRCSTTQVSIFLGAVTHGIVTGNRLTSTNDIGLHYYYTGSGSPDGNVAIVGNIFRDCAKNAILVEGGNDITIASNSARGCCWKADQFADIYKSVIGVQQGGGSTPDTLTIQGNTLIKGAITAGTLYGVSVLNSPTNLDVQGNNVVGSGFTNRFRYGTLMPGGTWSVQSDVFQNNSSKKMLLPNYSNLVSTTPTAGAKCWHDTYGELRGTGTAWETKEGWPAPGTTGATTTKTKRKLEVPNYNDLAGVSPTPAFAVHDTHGLIYGGGGEWKKVTLGTAVTP